jgi:hypothetical protein
MLERALLTTALAAALLPGAATAAPPHVASYHGKTKEGTTASSRSVVRGT